jgi:transcriptional regulator with XRE-family HTH domain
MAKEKPAKRFGELVRRLRQVRGYSQEGFSLRVGLHQTYVSSIEHGERNVVTIGTTDRMAKALGASAPRRRISSGSWSEDRLARPRIRKVTGWRRGVRLRAVPVSARARYPPALSDSGRADDSLPPLGALPTFSSDSKSTDHGLPGHSLCRYL